MRGGYYDIYDFLAEEEMIQCKTTFDFSYLSHLDTSNDNMSNNNNNSNIEKHVLKENSKIIVPLWMMKKWYDLGFCTIVQLPYIYKLKSRELTVSSSIMDPTTTNNNNNNNTSSLSSSKLYYRTGHALITTLLSSCQKNITLLQQSSSLTNTTTTNNVHQRNQQIQQYNYLIYEMNQLRTTLLQAYTGQRLQQIIDWSISNVGDDSTYFIQQLYDMELSLYYTISIAYTYYTIYQSMNGYYYHRYSGNNNNNNSGSSTTTKKSTKQSVNSNVNSTVSTTSTNNNNNNTTTNVRTITPTNGSSDDHHNKRYKPTSNY